MSQVRPQPQLVPRAQRALQALLQAQRDSQVPQELPGLPGWRVRQESLVHPLPVQLEVPSLERLERG